MRKRLKRDYFNQRLEGIKGDLRATWEVLGEVLRGRKGREGSSCCYFEKGGVPVTFYRDVFTNTKIFGKNTSYYSGGILKVRNIGWWAVFVCVWKGGEPSIIYPYYRIIF